MKGKAAFWKLTATKLHDPWEPRFKSAYSAVMKELQPEVIRGDTPFDLQKWQVKTVAAMHPLYSKLFNEAGRFLISSSKGVREGIVTKAFGQRLPAQGTAVELVSFLSRRISMTIETTYNAIRAIFEESLRDNLTAEQVLDLIYEEFADVFGLRGDDIARTEVAGVIANANAYLLQQTVDMSEWATAQDDLVRPTHVVYGEAAPKPVGFNYAKLVGEGYLLRWPHDPECEEAGEIINCRCIPIPAGEFEGSEDELNALLGDTGEPAEVIGG